MIWEKIMSSGHYWEFMRENPNDKINKKKNAMSGHKHNKPGHNQLKNEPHSLTCDQVC